MVHAGEALLRARQSDVESNGRSCLDGRMHRTWSLQTRVDPDLLEGRPQTSLEHDGSAQTSPEHDKSDVPDFEYENGGENRTSF